MTPGYRLIYYAPPGPTHLLFMELGDNNLLLPGDGNYSKTKLLEKSRR